MTVTDFGFPFVLKEIPLLNLLFYGVPTHKIPQTSISKGAEGLEGFKATNISVITP